jgi:photosystem II stability/assembly factor-like uncharacterized protein
MKKIFFSFFLSFLLQQSTLTQEGWFWQNPLPQGNHLIDVHFTDQNYGWAVGYIGTILKTTDAGNSWISQRSGINDTLLSVYFADQNHG